MPPLPHYLFHARLSPSLLRPQFSAHEHQQNYRCPSKNQEKKLTTFGQLLVWKYKDWIFIGTWIRWVRPHTGKRTWSFLANEPVAKRNVTYLSRPMSPSLRTKDAVWCLSVDPYWKKLCQRRNSFVVWTLGCQSLLCTHPFINLLDVLTLILTSKVKLE